MRDIVQNITAFIVAEQRQADRQKVDFAAEGLVPNIGKSIGCKVIDMSEIGMRIELLNTFFVPTKFKLHIPELECLNECSVVRRSGPLVGLRIENKISLPD